MNKRFSIRTGFVVTSMAAIAFWCGPMIYRRARFAEHYERLAISAAGWERTPGLAEGYEFQASNGVWLSVWTCEHSFADKYSLAVCDDATPDSSRFFVVPPGKWVDTIDDVITTWDEYD